MKNSYTLYLKINIKSPKKLLTSYGSLLIGWGFGLLVFPVVFKLIESNFILLIELDLYLGDIRGSLALSLKASPSLFISFNSERRLPWA